MKTIKTGIICGCLPKQYGIKAEMLYHQLLSQKTKSLFGITLEISSIWYTTLFESTQKSIELITLEKPSLLIYHVRPDPFLRISKLIVRYYNINEVSKTKFNFNADDSMIIDKENNERANIHRKKKSVFKSLLLHLNYILGYTFGVNHKGIFKEIKILNNLISYCEQKNITLFIVGPASRPRSRIENSLLYKLEKNYPNIMYKTIT